ncbi:hypothetical protein EYF80_035471 [Liparis tanakae]|uniref:Uncharacterized protein n=1 Tax=Liparis tanakae TaxID=230148 RepID=A0A4Z2GM74_9TELE|nr:hypothetical protein EYF80_035471 [Liparis tanakae]
MTWQISTVTVKRPDASDWTSDVSCSRQRPPSGSVHARGLNYRGPDTLEDGAEETSDVSQRLRGRFISTVAMPTADPGVAAVLPDDVIVVAQVKPLAVLPGVVHHTDPGHEVHHLLPGGVEQVIPALMAPTQSSRSRQPGALRSDILAHLTGGRLLLVHSGFFCWVKILQSASQD